MGWSREIIPSALCWKGFEISPDVLVKKSGVFTSISFDQVLRRRPCLSWLDNCNMAAPEGNKEHQAMKQPRKQSTTTQAHKQPPSQTQVPSRSQWQQDLHGGQETTIYGHSCAMNGLLKPENIWPDLTGQYKDVIFIFNKTIILQVRLVCAIHISMFSEL